MDLMERAEKLLNLDFFFFLFFLILIVKGLSILQEENVVKPT